MSNNARAPWRPLDVLIVIILAVAGTISISALMLVALSALEAMGVNGSREWLTDTIAGMTMQLVLQWAFTLGPALLFLRARGYRLSSQLLGFRRTRPGRALLYLLGILFAYLFVVLPLYQDILELFGISFESPQEIMQSYDPAESGLTVALAASIIHIAVIVPLAEELFFRGIIYQGLESRWGFWPAAIVSAAIFTLPHFYPIIFFPIFMLGFAFAALFYLTRSLWPPIAAHAIINSLVVIAYFVMDSGGPANGG